MSYEIMAGGCRTSRQVVLSYDCSLRVWQKLHWQYAMHTIPVLTSKCPEPHSRASLSEHFLSLTLNDGTTRLYSWHERIGDGVPPIRSLIVVVDNHLTLSPCSRGYGLVRTHGSADINRQSTAVLTMSRFLQRDASLGPSRVFRLYSLHLTTPQ